MILHLDEVGAGQRAWHAMSSADRERLAALSNDLRLRVDRRILDDADHFATSTGRTFAATLEWAMRSIRDSLDAGGYQFPNVCQDYYAWRLDTQREQREIKRALAALQAAAAATPAIGGK